jgi:cell division protein FtsB
MNWGGPEFVIAIIAISTTGWVISSWIRARHGYPVENEWSGMSHKGDPEAKREITQLTDENDALKAQVAGLNERLAVLERIATDQPSKLAREIDSLSLDKGGHA